MEYIKKKFKKPIWFIIISLLVFFSYRSLTKPIQTLPQEKTKEKTTHAVTVVSAYFLLQKSKFNGKKYENWIRTFFESVSVPLVLFTDGKSLSQELIRLRSSRTNPTIFYKYDSHWQILEEIGNKRGKNYSFNYKQNQNKLDPESSIHNQDLYLLWNVKSYITNKVAQENPFKSTLFIYTDSGAWRTSEPFYDWPNVSFVTKLGQQLEDRILFGEIANVKLEASKPDVNWIEGGFFLGSPMALNNFETAFWRIHDQRFEQGLFIGKDQTMMNLVATETPKKIVKLKAWDSGCPVDVWFFYQYFFAADQFYFSKCKRSREELIEFYEIRN